MLSKHIGNSYRLAGGLLNSSTTAQDALAFDFYGQ